MVYLNLVMLGVVSAMGYMLVSVPEGISPPEPRYAATQLTAPEFREISLEFDDRAKFAAITERPLFTLDRRPFVPDAKPAKAKREPTAKAPAPNVTLSGIVSVGDERRALMALPTEQAKLFRKGQAIRGWRITDISDNAVELSFGERQHTVRLHGGDDKGQGKLQQSGDRTRQRAAPAFGLDMSDQID